MNAPPSLSAPPPAIGPAHQGVWQGAHDEPVGAVLAVMASWGVSAPPVLAAWLIRAVAHAAAVSRVCVVER